MRLNLIAICIFLFLISSCKQIESKDKESGGSGSSDTQDGFGTVNGQLMMEKDGEEVPAKNANVTVQSHPEYSATADGNGNVALKNMLPGTLTIYAETTTDGGTTLADSSNARAAQFKDILVMSGKKTDLPPDVVLTEPGTISGTVALINNPENVELVGIEVYIPGTSFSAKTDEDGEFTISNVPAGEYETVRFDKDGLTSSEITDVEVKSGKDADLSTIYMSLSTGPSGMIVGLEDTTEVTIAGETVDVLQDHDVTVNLKYDSRAVLMKVAHESSFINVDWVPVDSSYTFSASNNSSAYRNYSTDGEKNVFVKFADSNGLESSVYQKEFIVDTETPTTPTVTLLYGWGQVYQSAAGIHMTISSSDSGTGISQVMACSNSSYSGCSWNTYSSSYYGSGLITGAGTNYIYVKVRDYIGNVKESAVSSITGGSYTIITSTEETENITLYKEEEKYQIDSAITFQQNLTIEEGVTLNLNISDGYLTVNGRFQANGTSGSPIQITTIAGFDGIDLSDSPNNDNLISYVNLDMDPSSGTLGITIDGGTISHSTFESAVKIIKKVGYRPLMIHGNSFTTNTTMAIQVWQGTNATTINDNYFAVAGGSTADNTAIEQSGTATGTEITYNTFSITFTNPGAEAPVMEIWTGNATINYNNITATANSGTAVGIWTESSAGTVTVEHNNISISNTGSAANVVHLKESAGTINPNNNSYTGTGTNPTNTGCSDASPHGGAFGVTTAAGADCVGYNCD